MDTQANTTQPKLIDKKTLGTYGFVYDAMIKSGLNIQTDDQKQFQFVSLPQKAGWTSTINGFYADLWGNHAAAGLGPTMPGPQMDIADPYYEFVQTLVAPPPKAAEYEKLNTQLTALTDQYGALKKEEVTAYELWQTGQGKNFPDIKTIGDWETSDYTAGSTYITQKNNLSGRITNVNEQIEPYMKGAALVYQQARNAVDPKVMIDVAKPGGGTTKIYPTSFAPELSEFIATMSGGGTVSPMSVSFGAKDEYNGSWSVATGGAAGLPLEGFFFGGEGGYKSSTVIQNDAELAVNLNIKGLQAFNIVRDNWFKSSMIAEHMEGPYSGTGSTGKQFFGAEKGTLKLVPSQVLVAYGTTFSLTTSTSAYKSVETEWNAEVGLMIGPFFFGADILHKSKEVTQSGDTTTISLGSNDDPNAYIIGVASSLYLDGE